MSNSNKEDKQYGLIIPKKQQLLAPKPINIFEDDNGSDEDDGTDWVRKALKAESEKNKVKKQTKLNIQKALKEDPTIYQYDEVYDDMERTKAQQQIPKKEKKPRYIQSLLKAAERRKKEQEHRIERMVQKEREAEGSMYADKESFVTSAYRAKLEEFKKMEEEESRMDRLEAIADVTKQPDMSGFYKHLYEQTVDNPNQSADDNDSRNDKKDNTEESKNRSNNLSMESPSKSTNTHRPEKQQSIKNKKSRQYRQRVIESYESESESETQKDKHTISETIPNAESGSTEIEISEPDKKKQKQVDDNKSKEKCDEMIQEKLEQEKENIITSNQVLQNCNAKHMEDNVQNNKDHTIIKSIEIKEKPSIWEKRTVGPVFEAALQRYYARKAMKLPGA